MLVLMVLVLAITLLLGFPMKIPLILSAMTVLFAEFPWLSISTLIRQMISGVETLSLIAVPMFIFAAGIMTKGESSERLLGFVSDFVKHLPGGLAITTAAACTTFGAISGSTQATVVAMGSPMLPKLINSGYSSSFSLALIINASDIALLIPPSIGMIVYGVVTGTSVGELFIAGIGPGILVFLMFSVFLVFYSKYMAIPLAKKASWRERWASAQKAFLCFGFPLLIIGGIYAGLFSPNEAAGVGVMYAFILEVFIYKSINIKDVLDIALETGLITAVVFVLIGMGSAFSWIISFARIPSMLLPSLFGHDPSPIRALLIIAAVYFIGCMIVDNIVVIIVLTPFIYPYAIAAGVDPVHLGVLVTLQAAIGSATPPFGCDIFTAIAVFRRPYLEVVRSTPPFIFILILASLLVIFFPDIALWLSKIAY